MAVDKVGVRLAVRDLLRSIGEDPTRPGLADTPARIARAWAEFIDYDPGTIATTFEHAALDQMVVVSGMRIASFCEHHLLPFWCDVSVGYIAAGRVIGLSKVARIAHKCAHKLQLQERLVEEIAADLIATLGCEDVAVLAQGEHSCMSMRGIRTRAVMTSSSLHGAFKGNHETRAEFIRLAAGGSHAGH